MWIERLMAGISHQHVLSYNPKKKIFADLNRHVKIFFFAIRGTIRAQFY